MGGIVEVSGGLSAGSPAGCGCGDASLVFPFEFPNGCSGVPYTTSTSGGRTVISTDWVSLANIGTGGDVTKCSLFALRGEGVIDLELKFDDGIGGTTTVITPMQGIHFQTYGAPKYLVGVRVRGNSTIQYFAAGPQ